MKRFNSFFILVVIALSANSQPITKKGNGGIHLSKENKQCDINRDITLNEFGIQIIRFTNEQVINDINQIIEVIKKKIAELKQK